MAFAERTLVSRGSIQRPVYKRPRDDKTVDLVNQNVVIDNSRVVPYNAYNLAKYNCHINFEVIGSIKTMKYLHKYLVKGFDSIRVEVDAGNELNEMQRYLNCRYVSLIKAAWRLFEFKMFDRSHTVTLLPVHLPGFRDVFYDEQDDVDEVPAALDKPSKLETFFILKAESPDARDLLYGQIPEYYIWNAGVLDGTNVERPVR
ncbi:unnamed protein product [Ceutorhynchus assimilis]|uniref:Uncharacterized protein n=1 Tax=Ceutorhynchus assimilis TaxID=467358 RepID=A0A9N9MRF8_9CUCU|nr:unnamed protein product [Ceutorhynchus assimilis]